MKKYILSLAVAVVASVIGSGVFAHAAQAASPLSGWAYSSTVGWISFNSADSGTGNNGVGTSPIAYSVTVSTSSPCSATAACLTGYAWSSNIGWISFNASDLSASPACAGASAASVDLKSGDTNFGSVTGWARAVSGEGSTAGDGCIQLSDSQYHSTKDPSGAHGVTYQNSGSQGLFNGYAWESSVLGWLSFAPMSGVGVFCASCSGTQQPPASTLAVSCSPSGTTNLSGPGNVTYAAAASGGTPPYSYSWDGGTTYAGYSTQIITAGASAYGPTLLVKDSASPAATATASPQCGNIVVASATGGIKLLVAPTTATLSQTDYIDPPSGPSTYKTLALTIGQSLQLQLNADPAGDFTQCSTSSSAGSWNFDLPPTGGAATVVTSGMHTGTYTLTETCSASGGTNIRSSSVTVILKNSSEGEL